MTADNISKMAQTVTEKTAEQMVNLDTLITQGIIEKESEPVPGLKVTMHTLTQAEREKACMLIPSVAEEQQTTIFGVSEREKVPVLTYAITKVHSEEFISDEQKRILYDKLRQLPLMTIDLMFLAYNTLCVEQLNLITEGFKKKS